MTKLHDGASLNGHFGAMTIRVYKLRPLSSGEFGLDRLSMGHRIITVGLPRSGCPRDMTFFSDLSKEEVWE